MTVLQVAAGAVAFAVLTGGCAGTAQPEAAPSSERLRPAPSSSLFSPAPFDVPMGEDDFWPAIENVADRLRPAADTSDVAAERRRLQACDHLAQIAEAIFRADFGTYPISDLAESNVMGAATICVDQPAVAYDAVQSVVSEKPSSP